MSGEEIEEQRAAVRREPATRPAKLAAWLWGVFAAASVTFAPQFAVLTWRSWTMGASPEPWANLPAALVYANPLGLTVGAWLIVRFGPPWARIGVFDKRWNYAGFFVATTLAHLVLASAAASIYHVVTAPPHSLDSMLLGFAIVLLFTMMAGLPLWAFVSALAIGPRGGGR